jgi:hypothetical protein
MDRRGTKDHVERETEEIERLVRPSPKVKPPRHDRRREMVEPEKDPDLDNTDKDLSKNYKTIGGSATRVLNRWAKDTIAPPAPIKPVEAPKAPGAHPSAPPKKKVKVRRKQDKRVVEVTEDALKENPGAYETYKEDAPQAEEKPQGSEPEFTGPDAEGRKQRYYERRGLPVPPSAPTSESPVEQGDPAEPATPEAPKPEAPKQPEAPKPAETPKPAEAVDDNQALAELKALRDQDPNSAQVLQNIVNPQHPMSFLNDKYPVSNIFPGKTLPKGVNTVGDLRRVLKPEVLQQQQQQQQPAEAPKGKGKGRKKKQPPAGTPAQPAPKDQVQQPAQQPEAPAQPNAQPPAQQQTEQPPGVDSEAQKGLEALRSKWQARPDAESQKGLEALREKWKDRAPDAESQKGLEALRSKWQDRPDADSAKALDDLREKWKARQTGLPGQPGQAPPGQLLQQPGQVPGQPPQPVAGPQPGEVLKPPRAEPVQPQPPKRPVSQAEENAARNLVIHTFPSGTAADLLSVYPPLHPDEINALVSTYKVAKTVDIPQGKIDDLVEKAAKFYSTDPSNISAPRMVRAADGSEVKYADLPPEEKALELRKHQLKTVAMSLAARDAIASNLQKKSKAPPELASQMADFLLNKRENESPASRVHRASQQAERMFYQALSSEDNPNPTDDDTDDDAQSPSEVSIPDEMGDQIEEAWTGAGFNTSPAHPVGNLLNRIQGGDPVRPEDVKAAIADLQKAISDPNKISGDPKAAIAKLKALQKSLKKYDTSNGPEPELEKPDDTNQIPDEIGQKLEDVWVKALGNNNSSSAHPVGRLLSRIQGGESVGVEDVDEAMERIQATMDAPDKIPEAGRKDTLKNLKELQKSLKAFNSETYKKSLSKYQGGVTRKEKGDVSRDKKEIDDIFKKTDYDSENEHEDLIPKKKVPGRVSEDTIKSVMLSTRDPEVRRLAVGYFQAQDYKDARKMFLDPASDTSISEAQPAHIIAARLEKASQFLRQRGGRYPAHLQGQDPALVFRGRVMKQLASLAPEKVDEIQDKLNIHDNKFYDKSVRTYSKDLKSYQKAYKAAEQHTKSEYAAYSEKLKQGVEVDPPLNTEERLLAKGLTQPKEPVKPAHYDIAGQDEQVVAQKAGNMWDQFTGRTAAHKFTMARVAHRSVFFTCNASSAMGHRTAVYWGKAPNTTEPYRGWEQPSAGDLHEGDLDRVITSARKWLESPVLSDHVDGIVRDTQLRAALDLAIRTENYNNAIHPTVYNLMLARLAGLPKDETLHTVTAQVRKTMTDKIVIKVAQLNKILERLDRMASIVQEKHEEWGMQFEAAKALVNEMDKTADALELNTYGEKSLVRRQASVMGITKGAAVMEREPDEKYMDAFQNPMEPHQTNSDEPYMKAYADDQSSAVINGKAENGRALAPNR